MSSPNETLDSYENNAATSEPTTNTMQNRSEIVFITDAQDCNPNGNPLGENRPRIDLSTDQAVVTDVRLKRYLRDQLSADGHGVFVKKTANGTSGSRAELALDVLGNIESEEDLEDSERDIEAEFLKAAVDVRYFGATLSFNADDEGLKEAIADEFNSGNYTGPVQFSPARSLNAVEENDESNTLTSVISTTEEKDVGGYGLDDHRLKYAIFPFHGLVDEHGAEDTGLRTTDVERLDTLCWRAMKNQTISRSKVGQEPRLYVRVEYETEGFHAGDLHNGFRMDKERSKPDAELRNIMDITVDVTAFIDRLVSAREHIKTVYFVGSDYLTLSYHDEDIGSAADLGSLLSEKGIPNQEIDVYSEFEKTLPETSDD